MVCDLHAHQPATGEEDHFVRDCTSRNERKHSFLGRMERDGGKPTFCAGSAESLSCGVTFDPRQQTDGHLCLYQRCWYEGSTVLLRHESQIEQRGTPASRCLVERHIQYAHSAQPCPQVSIVTGRLRLSHPLDWALFGIERREGVDQLLLFF